MVSASGWKKDSQHIITGLQSIREFKNCAKKSGKNNSFSVVLSGKMRKRGGTDSKDAIKVGKRKIDMKIKQLEGKK